MGFAAERKAIEERFLTQWALSTKSAVVTLFENSAISPPTEEPFVALYIRSGAGQQISLGSSPLDRYDGLIIVQVFVPEETGTQEAREIADVVETIFKRQSFSSGAGGLIRCRLAALDPMGNKAGWLQSNVSIPYQRDEQ